MALINTTDLVGGVIVSLATDTFGSWVLLGGFMLMFFVAVMFAFKLPIELVIVFIIPLAILLTVYGVVPPIIGGVVALGSSFLLYLAWRG